MPITRNQKAPPAQQAAGQTSVRRPSLGVAIAVIAVEPRPMIVAGGVSGPSTLLRLYVEGGQSPWLDHLTRGSLEDGSLGRGSRKASVVSPSILPPWESDR